MNLASRTMFLFAPSLAGLRRRWRNAVRARLQRAELRALRALGQHELNDLGVGHSELPGLARAAD